MSERLTAEELERIRTYDHYYGYANSAVRKLGDHIDALTAEVAQLLSERHWSMQFHCSNCGVIGAEYITTKKTCAHCDATVGGSGKTHHLVRSKHPYVAELESENARLRKRIEAWKQLERELADVRKRQEERNELCQQRLRQHIDALTAENALLRQQGEAANALAEAVELKLLKAPATYDGDSEMVGKWIEGANHDWIRHLHNSYRATATDERDG